MSGNPKNIVSKIAPDPVDLHVGNRLRMRRTLLGMSEERLGKAVGLTCQQIQDYEDGRSRVKASKLWAFSSILDVTINWFFEDLDDLGFWDREAGTDKLPTDVFDLINMATEDSTRH